MTAKAALFTAMILGLGIALLDSLAFQTPPDQLSAQDVAVVAGQRISQSSFEQASREAKTPAQAQRVLDRMVDELLLISYALDQDIATQSPRLRKALVDEVLALVDAQAQAQTPSDEELQTFWQNNQEYFRPARLYQLSLCRHADQSSAQQARQDLIANGGSCSTKDPLVPVAPIPEHKLAPHLGEELAQAVRAQEQAGLSPVFEREDQAVFVDIHAVTQASLPSFAELRSALLAEWQRRKGDEALRSLLKQLRADYDVQQRPLDQSQP